MRKGILIAAAIVALAGVAVAAISTSQHLRLKREGFETASFCAVSERINCDVVNASSYAEFFHIPTAWWGLVFYVLMAGMSIAAAVLLREARPTIAVAWILSGGSVVASCLLAYVAVAVLGVVCIECLAMYAINIALFILFFCALGVPLRRVVRFLCDYARAAVGRPSFLEFAPHVVRHLIIAAAVFAVGVLAMKGVVAGKGDESDGVSAEEKVHAFYLQSLYAIEPSPSWPVWGNPQAKVTVVEFSDFQCPFCRLAAFNIRPYLQEFRNDVRFFFVNYPLDNACNDGVERPMHPKACLAAKAVTCAAKRGDFWAYHDDLFRQQQKIGEELVLSLAEKRGWPRAEFQGCIDSPETDAAVRQEIAAARKIYVSGTPTVFIDNRKVRYWRDPDFLRAVVREEIRRVNRGEGVPAATPSR